MTTVPPAPQAPASPAARPPGIPGARPNAGASAAPPANSAATQTKKLDITDDVDKRGKRIVMYAPGGWGKTSIAAMAPGSVTLDLEKRTGHVAEKLGNHNVKMRRFATLGMKNGEVDSATMFADTRAALHNFDLFPAGSTIIIDSVTKLEECSWNWVVENIGKEKGGKVTGIEDYGYGKGYTHGFEQMVKVLGDLDALSARGVNSILICHDCVANFDDPAQVGEHKRYEPRLYRSGSGNTDTRLRVREWSDAVLFGTYDMARDQQGRVTGQGTRIIYTHERPAFMAKSSLGPEHFQVPVAHEFDDRIWKLLFA